MILDYKDFCTLVGMVQMESDDNKERNEYLSNMYDTYLNNDKEERDKLNDYLVKETAVPLMRLNKIAKEVS